MTKSNQYRTKKKQQREATAEEADKLIAEYLLNTSTQRVKAREILEEYLEGKENTGERRS